MQKKEQIDILYIIKHLTDKMIITLYLKINSLTKNVFLKTSLKMQGMLKTLFAVVLSKSGVYVFDQS